MIVVADSSPLIVLVNIGHERVLSDLFGHIVIPDDVAAELAGPRRPEIVRAFIVSPPPWIEIRAPLSVEPIPDLHAGENAAISLARELRADALLIDERRGRRAATDRGLQVIGTIGVLEAAAARGLLDLEQAFEMVKQTDF